MNWFEYIFDATDPSESSDEESESNPLLSQVFQRGHRTAPSTFGSNQVPSYGRLKSQINLTRDVFKILMDGSADFLMNKTRIRSRLLERPEMWDRIIPSDPEPLNSVDYEAIIYQLFEFRILYEYLNIGWEGPGNHRPFDRIRKTLPSDEDRLKTLRDCEEGRMGDSPPPRPAAVASARIPATAVKAPPQVPKKRKVKKKKSGSAQIVSSRASRSDSSSPSASDTESPRSSRPPAPAQSQLLQDFPDTSEDEDEWETAGRRRPGGSRKNSTDRPPIPPTLLPRLRPEMVSRKLGGWQRSSSGLLEDEDELVITRGTFVEVVKPSSSERLVIRECPF